LLRKHFQRLIGVDVNPNCIDTCKYKFANDDDDIELHVNDGRSPGMGDDDSIDFAFSVVSIHWSTLMPAILRLTWASWDENSAQEAQALSIIRIWERTPI
jgi:hypothetical protein